MSSKFCSWPNLREKVGFFGMEKYRLILWTIFYMGSGVVMLIIIKVFIILFVLVRIGNILTQNKSVNSAFNLLSRYILFLVKLKGRKRPFLKGARRRATLWDCPQEHLVASHKRWKSLLFVKFEMTTSPLFFIRPPYKWALQDMEYFYKFVDRFQDISKVKIPAVSKAKV